MEISQNYHQTTEMDQGSEWWSESQFRDLLDHLNVGIVVHDQDTKILYSNQAASKLLGLSFGQMQGRVVSDPEWHFIRQDRTPISIEEFPVSIVISSQKPFKNKILGIIRPDRYEPVWVICNGHPEFNHQGKLVRIIINFSDFSEELALKEKLQVAKEVAESANIIKSRFLDIAAHELRTPVTAFSLLLQLTRRQLEKSHPVELFTIARLESQAERLAGLVVDLLDVSRLERGMVTLKLEVSEMNSLISEVIEDFKLRSAQRVITFLTLTDSIRLKMDRLRVYQVLSNLLDNAVKYTPEESPIEITMMLMPHHQVKISVIDHGPGILPEKQSVLFNPFSRGVSEEVEKSAGLGLGLYICKGIVELHGGTIGLTSKIGLGSTFYFELPLLNEEVKT